MHKTDVKDLNPWLLRKIGCGEPVIVTHRGRDMCAIISLDLLYLLEGLQLESLEEEDNSAEDIAELLRKISGN